MTRFVGIDDRAGRHALPDHREALILGLEDGRQSAATAGADGHHDAALVALVLG